jgi:hypothetical protein
MIKLGALAESVDLSRIDAYRKLKPGHRAQYGQFFTGLALWSGQQGWCIERSMVSFLPLRLQRG